MNSNNQMKEISKICDDILRTDVWHNFNESFFWPLISLLDVNSNDIIRIYESSNDRQLSILFHDKVINPLIESTQSTEIINYLIKLKENNSSKVDDYLILDAEMSLFSNYSDECTRVFVDDFNCLYMTLKDSVFDMMRNSLSLEKQKSNLRMIKKYMEDNKHEFFSYVHVYWLCLYINNFVDENLKNGYRNSLKCFFPRANF